MSDFFFKNFFKMGGAFNSGFVGIDCTHREFEEICDLVGVLDSQAVECKNSEFGI